MLTTGNQLKAARALIGIDQRMLAQAAGININTVCAMERRRHLTLTSGNETIVAVANAFEAAGVEFVRGGVRLTDA